MSIENETTVDALGIEASTGMVVLSIFDHLDWANTADHFAALARKINAYLEFLESGHLVENMPEAHGRKLKIAVHQKFEPHLDARAVLNALTEKLEALGVAFWYGSLPAGH